MIVVKIGGGEGIDLEAVATDAAALIRNGRELALVHGGSHLTNQVAEQLGHPARFVTSPSGHTSRRTDRRTLEIFTMVYCGLVNKRLVEALQKHGINAVGLSGLDGRIWEGPRKEAIRIVENGRTRVLRDDFTGRVEKVNTLVLSTFLAAGYLPVLTPPAVSHDGEMINVDGDRAAAATAVALKAEQLVILSAVPGLLENFPDETSLVRHVDKARIDAAERMAQGRMKKKIMGAGEALDGGVQSVVLADGRIDNPISAALEGAGTVIS